MPNAKPAKIIATPRRLIASVVVLCAIAVALLLVRVVESESLRYIFLIWNLALAGVAPLAAWWLAYRVRKYGWLKWQQVILTFVWLVFLPNSFYLITDFIHLRPNYEASLMYDIVLLTAFTLSGLVLGYYSVFMVQKELLKRLDERHVWYMIGSVFLAVSFAIYLGRFSRWNSWDILLKPAGLLFDVSDRIVNPAAHSDTYATTFLFFVLLASGYWVVWEFASYIRNSK